MAAGDGECAVTSTVKAPEDSCNGIVANLPKAAVKQSFSAGDRWRGMEVSATAQGESEGRPVKNSALKASTEREIPRCYRLYTSTSLGVV
ncbi:hypothetical protein R3I93_017700 [Phoxinus phoxinus]|uniref:Uncharacterized protein n=1 Tax=Phoxinus phoxinus TaxID=58324 RepID=A0AAN9CET3_9TELE